MKYDLFISAFAVVVGLLCNNSKESESTIVNTVILNTQNRTQKEALNVASCSNINHISNISNAPTRIAINTNATPKRDLQMLYSKTKYLQPMFITIIELIDTDKPVLIEEFRNQSLTNKFQSSWALAYLGGSDVFSEFRKVLEYDYHTNILNAQEMQMMLHLTRCIGHLAKENTDANNYINEHLTPDKWIGVRKWNCDDEPRDLNILLSRAMIMGVGISGRDEARNILDDIMQWDQNKRDALIPGIVDAYYYLSLSKTMSRKDFVLHRVAQSDTDTDITKWQQTEEGSRMYKMLIKYLHSDSK